MAKLLVVDKCCLQGMGQSRLNQFMKEYQVILPHVLAIECLISDDRSGTKPAKSPINLLHRVEAAVKAGAYFGRSSVSIHREEVEKRRPVVQIVDEEATQVIRKGTAALTEDFVRREAEECKRKFENLIKPVSDLAKRLHAEIRQSGHMASGFQGEFREMNRVELLRRNLQAASQKKDQILQKFVSSVAADVTDEWYTWQVIRLWYGWAIEWASRRADLDAVALPSDVSNDFYDMEYVASLFRSDGLVTGDKKLVEPLARAAFPEKDVFSCLEEVPESYRCDWVE